MDKQDILVQTLFTRGAILPKIILVQTLFTRGAILPKIILIQALFTRGAILHKIIMVQALFTRGAICSKIIMLQTLFTRGAILPKIILVQALFTKIINIYYLFTMAPMFWLIFSNIHCRQCQPPKSWRIVVLTPNLNWILSASKFYILLPNLVYKRGNFSYFFSLVIDKICFDIWMLYLNLPIKHLIELIINKNDNIHKIKGLKRQF